MIFDLVSNLFFNNRWLISLILIGTGLALYEGKSKLEKLWKGD
jgi:hypothetical protein